MKLIDGLNFISSINEKLYNNIELENGPNRNKYFETLHSEMVELFKNFTEVEYNNISLMLRKSIERLEKELLDRCSYSYKTEYEQYLLNNNKFRNAKTNKKQQNQIGFVALEEKGFND